jgi:uncharacterized membrane protein YfcA
VATPLLVLASAFAAAIGALGGLGGALLLVPLLVATGTSAADAAPLGLVLVAAGSIAGGSRHLEDRSVNHRLGVATEVAASTGAVIGALVSGSVSEEVLVYALAVVALIAAAAGGGRKGIRNQPHPAFGPEHVGERIGTLGGAVARVGGVAPYRVQRLPLGLGAMSVAGLVSGLSGVGGGFIKTPVMSEIMHVPVKVAAATSTFTVGITAAVGLIVFAAQGRIEAHPAAAVIIGSVAGGLVGGVLQGRLRAPSVRRLLSVVLVFIAVLLVATA